MAAFNFGNLYGSWDQKVKIFNYILLFFLPLDDKAMLKEYPTTVNGMFDSWRERWTQEEAREIDVILDILVERNSEHFKTS